MPQINAAANDVNAVYQRLQSSEQALSSSSAVLELADYFERRSSELFCGPQSHHAREGARAPTEELPLLLDGATKGNRLLVPSAFSFAFTRKGLEEDPTDWLEDFRLIRIPIRGVSKEELVYVLRREFMTLSARDKKRYGK